MEQGVNRGRAATEASTSAWADVWHKIDAWVGLGDDLSVRRVKAHNTPDAVRAGTITADNRAGNDLADAACNLVVLEHRALPFVGAASHSANLAVACVSHWIARPGSAWQRLDIDAVWILGRANARRQERVRASPVAGAPAFPVARAQFR